MEHQVVVVSECLSHNRFGVEKMTAKTLTPQERQKANDWIAQRAPNLRCQGCGGKSFGVHEQLLEGTTYQGVQKTLGGQEQIVPMVLHICNTCALVVPFLAGPMGLLP